MHEPFYKLSFVKAGHLRDFQHYCVSKFTSYFTEFGDLMMALLKTLFPNNDMNDCSATHNAMLEILNPVFEWLPDKQPHKPKPKPTDQQQVSQIHQLQLSSHWGSGSVQHTPQPLTLTHPQVQVQ